MESEKVEVIIVYENKALIENVYQNILKMRKEKERNVIYGNYI